MDGWDAQQLASALPASKYNPAQWAAEVRDELALLQDIVGRSYGASDDFDVATFVDAHIPLLRTPTVEELIHQECLKIRENISKTWSSGSPSGTIVDGFFVYGQDHPNVPSPSTTKQRRLVLLCPSSPTFDWNEQSLLIHERATTSLESFKLAFDFDVFRFKRLFVPYNFMPNAHKNTTRLLEISKRRKQPPPTNALALPSCHSPNAHCLPSQQKNASLAQSRISQAECAVDQCRAHDVQKAPSTTTATVPQRRINELSDELSVEPICSTQPLVPTFVKSAPARSTYLHKNAVEALDKTPARSRQLIGWCVAPVSSTLPGSPVKTSATLEHLVEEQRQESALVLPNSDTRGETLSASDTALSVARRDPSAKGNVLQAKSSVGKTLEPKPPLVSLPLARVPDDTVIVTVSFYHPVRGLKSAEFDVLAFQTLASLKDCFKCDEDFCCYSQKYNASFFFIDGVFYVDGRQLDAPDICERLAAYLKRVSPGKVREQNYRQFMEATPLNRLDIPWNTRCAYFHRGDCEHRMIFSSMRKFDATLDCPYQDGYPLAVYRPATKVTQCQACLVNMAEKTILNSPRLPQSAVQLCSDCFNAFFFAENGTFIEDDDGCVYMDYQDVA